MRRWAPATVLLVLSMNGVLAAEVVPIFDNQRAGVAILHLPLPDTLGRDLQSGLTSRLLIRVILMAESRPLSQQTVEMAVKYDLWDETFAVIVKVGGNSVATQSLRSLSEVMLRLEELRLPNLFATGSLDMSRPLTLEVDLLLNPIEKERMEQIRKWVAQNTTHTAPVDPDSPASTAPLVDSTGDLIFNRIFEQYAAGATEASVWHLRLESTPFTLKELTHVRP